MKSRRPTSLDREQIVRAAVELIDRDGLAALSMRRLAAALGIEAMSLYHHVHNKEELLDACIEHVAASLDISGMQAPGPWRARLTAGFSAYRAVAHVHPELFALLGRRPVRRLEALRPMEVALGVLTEAGFTPAQAIRAFRIVNSFAYGYALSELTGLAVQAAATGTLEGDPDDFPNLSAVLPIVAALDRDAEFKAGLDTVLDGIATWLPPAAGRRRAQT
jgi:AcrR family transcriptional regulator